MDNKFLNKFTSLVFYLSLLIFIIAFSFAHNLPGGWTQQFLPFMNDRPLSDMTFIDSLTGYGITGDGTVGDTNYIIKTSDGGENWDIILAVYRDLSRVIFINSLTGYVSGGFNALGSYLIKSSDGGTTWNQINTPGALRINDMSVINEDSLWITDKSFSSNVYNSTNGGLSWELKYTTTVTTIENIYFKNSLGFLSLGYNLLRTSNFGVNWATIPGERAFVDIYFSDTLKGWKRNAAIGNDTLVKTTDGGLNWINANVPRSGFIYGGILSGTIGFFTNINNDTIWGAGGYLKYSGTRNRGILFKSTNSGKDWLIQVPDTSFGISYFGYIDFLNKSNGWSYNNENGIHTISGGDTIFYTKVENNHFNILNNFLLYQNYPNPFNPITKINYYINIKGKVQLKVYNIIGKEIDIIVNENQNRGDYKVEFDGSGYSSGVYFYSLFIDNKRIDTKKMLLIR